MSINCLCAEGIFGLGSKYIIVCLNVNYVKNTGRSNIGCHKDTVSSRTLCAITRNGTHREIIFTNTLGDESGRSTTVTVCSPLATESKHNFALFKLTAKTFRVVSTTTVVHTNNESTIFFDTNHGTCSIAGGLANFRSLYKFSIFDNHAKRYANRVKQNAFFKVLVKISLVVRLYITGNIAFSILKYIKN